MKSPKSINSLMVYLRDHHKISISGSSQKQKLRNIGYYHGFKGYRYNEAPQNRIAYTDFDQILAINEFDMSLKAIFYPQIMFVETSLKNYVLEIVLSEGKTSNFNDIFSNILTGYKQHPTSSEKYRKAMQKRLGLRNKIYSTLTSAYANNKKVVTHFYHKDENVPIWAMFEVISLGEFGTFIQCLDQSIRAKISIALALNQTCDTNSELTQSIIYTIKDLRNAVSHNEIIFDTRFRNSNIARNVISCLEIETGIQSIKFTNIIDYLILNVYLLKNLKMPKREILKSITVFEESIETLRKRIPISMYAGILPTNTRNKLTQLKSYAKK